MRTYMQVRMSGNLTDRDGVGPHGVAIALDRGAPSYAAPTDGSYVLATGLVSLTLTATLAPLARRLATGLSIAAVVAAAVIAEEI